MSFIKKMLNRNNKSKILGDKLIPNSQTQINEVQYLLSEVYICNLAKHLDKSKIETNNDIKQSFIKDDIMVISVDFDTYMDIENGKCYKIGTFFKKDEQTTNGHFIFGIKPLYCICHSTVTNKNLQPNDKLTYKELRSLYIEHINNDVVNQ